MADDSRDDADNEITRIVRRPGPAQLPINVMRPPNATPPVSIDAAASVPPPAAAANDSAPPVAPPAAFDRPRPVMTPPPRPSVPPMGAVPLPPVPPNSVAPTPVAPAPVVLRPTPPVSVETRIAPIPAPIAAPVPGQSLTPAPIAERPAPTPVETARPSPAPAPAPVIVEAAQPVIPSISATAALPVVAPIVAAPVAVAVVAPAPTEPVVGWLVVIKGPGRGTAREIVTGRNGIGSSSGQAIKLDFGDPAIAPQGHAYVVYDDEARAFFVEDGKQKIVVRLNGKLLTETMPISHGDELRIGATTLRFVALCGPDFDWNEKEEKAAGVVSDVVAKVEADENDAAGEG